MVEKEEVKKIKVPFSLHVLGFLLFLVFLAIANLTGVIQLRLFGIILFWFVFSTCGEMYRKAEKDGDKNPFFSYFTYEFAILAVLGIGAILFSKSEFQLKIPVIIFFVILGAVLVGITKLSEFIATKSRAKGITTFVILLLLLLLGFGAWFYYVVTPAQISQEFVENLDKEEFEEIVVENTLDEAEYGGVPYL